MLAKYPPHINSSGAKLRADCYIHSPEVKMTDVSSKSIIIGTVGCPLTIDVFIEIAKSFRMRKFAGTGTFIIVERLQSEIW